MSVCTSYSLRPCEVKVVELHEDTRSTEDHRTTNNTGAVNTHRLHDVLPSPDDCCDAVLMAAVMVEPSITDLSWLNVGREMEGRRRPLVVYVAHQRRRSGGGGATRTEQVEGRGATSSGSRSRHHRHTPQHQHQHRPDQRPASHGNHGGRESCQQRDARDARRG